jgi:hypothetical protein
MTIESHQESALIQSNVFKQLILACENDAVISLTRSLALMTLLTDLTEKTARSL